MATDDAAPTLERLLREAGDVLAGRLGDRSLAEIRAGALRRVGDEGTTPVRRRWCPRPA